MKLILLHYYYYYYYHYYYYIALIHQLILIFFVSDNGTNWKTQTKVCKCIPHYIRLLKHQFSSDVSMSNHKQK